MLVAIPTGICEMTPEIPVLVESHLQYGDYRMRRRKPRAGDLQCAWDDARGDRGHFAHARQYRSADGRGNKNCRWLSGLKPELHSQLLKTAVEQYKKLFKRDPKVHAVHAGLECGLLIEKMPGLSAISIGPTIKATTPSVNEFRLVPWPNHTATCKPYWNTADKARVVTAANNCKSEIVTRGTTMSPLRILSSLVLAIVCTNACTGRATAETWEGWQKESF